MGRGNWNGKGEPMSRGARLYAWLLYVVVGLMRMLACNMYDGYGGGVV